MKKNKKTKKQKSIQDLSLPKKKSKKKKKQEVNPYTEFQSQVKHGFLNIVDFIKTHSINITLLLILLGIIGAGAFFIWISTFRVPDFSAFEDRKVAQSTKIYDRTGEILLFDVNQDIKRTVIPIEEMGENIQHAIISIEDDTFYEHNGFRFSAFMRAVLVNLGLRDGYRGQGGSTITQQIVKNTLLTSEKRISRKIKEIVIALRIEREMSKDQILEVYLNETPFGGNIYGVQEAATSFYGKAPADLTIAEAAFLAALPQAPTRYSPYGNNTDQLVARQRLVLQNMYQTGFITLEELNEALQEEVVFLPLNRLGIKAPHFVFYVRDYLEETYGQDVVEEGGLRVITTLNYDLQKEGERIVLKHALENEELYNASNAALVAIDPTSGEILTMVGSRDYFDTEIDGKFNIVTARRQPGSAFKPFIYATAFKEGFFPETVVFDVLTEFQTTCDEEGNALPGQNQNDCYSPRNYDGLFDGPINLRNALAQSRNIPAVKMLYLTGVADSLKTAKDLGIKTLGDANQYGLTLVLGGGEVRLLDMTTAYGVFATEGIYNEPTVILEVQNSDGEVLESFDRSNGERVFPADPLRKLNNVLSDPQARVGLFNSINNFMYFGDRDVAGKTGTTNNNRDAWMMGYTPNLVVGTWSGNNDNTPMTRGSSISGMLWREFMIEALDVTPNQSFTPAFYSTPENAPAILTGNWLGGDIVEIDTISGGLATQWTPEETKEQLVITDVNSILHWVNRNNPLSGNPTRNGNQYNNWQYGVHKWWDQNEDLYETIDENDIPEFEDDIHTEETQPEFEILGITQGFEYSPNSIISLEFEEDTTYDVESFDIYINNSYIDAVDSTPYEFTFRPSEISSIQENNTLRVVLTDEVYNKAEVEIDFKVED